MSRLREAQRCITNQLKYKNLNAFINIAEKDTVLKAAEDADEAGSPSKYFPPARASSAELIFKE